MNNEEAKFILRAYRPDGQDARDPQFAEALEQARLDPELGRWFAEQTTFDKAVSQKLQAIPVPADLRASILAGRKIIRPVPWWTRRLHPAAAAAMLALTFATIGLFAAREPAEAPADFKHFSNDLTDYLGKGYGVLPKEMQPATEQVGYFGDQSYRITYRSPSLDDIRQWLTTNGGHGEFKGPRGLGRALNLGCGVLNWRGRRVSLIAFQTGRSLPHDKIHVAIINSAELPDPPAPGVPSLIELGNWSTAAWNDGKLTYFLVAPLEPYKLAKFL